MKINSLYLPKVHLRAALPHIIIGKDVMMKTPLKAPISHITAVTDCTSSQLPVAKVKIIPRVLLTTATPTIPSILWRCQWLSAVEEGSHNNLHHIRITIHEVRHREVSCATPTKANETQANVWHWPGPAIIGSYSEEYESCRTDEGGGEHEPESMFSLRNPAITPGHPSNKQVGEVSTVDTADEGANYTWDIHNGILCVSIVPRRAVPIVFLESEVKGQPRILGSPLQPSKKDSRKCEDSKQVPKPQTILLEAKASEIGSGCD